MPKEIEIKFPVENEERTVRILLAAGARKASEGFEHNVVFDSGSLRKKGMLLRLRKTGGKSILTLKKRQRRGEFKEAEELETGIGDFSKAKEILSSLGYEVFWIYEKQKSVFTLGGTVITLDRLPFATFLEIEGSRAGIRSAMAKLGLDPKKGRTESYMKLYEQHCAEKGIEMDSLVFWKKARPRY